MNVLLSISGRKMCTKLAFFTFKSLDNLDVLMELYTVCANYLCDVNSLNEINFVFFSCRKNSNAPFYLVNQANCLLCGGYAFRRS